MIFKAFWTRFLMVSIKITCYYLFMLKNYNKHVKNTQKTCFWHFFGLKFENFQNWIQRFDSIFEDLSYAVFRLEKFQLLPEIFRKNWKISRKLLHSISNFNNPSNNGYSVGIPVRYPLRNIRYPSRNIRGLTLFSPWRIRQRYLPRLYPRMTARGVSIRWLVKTTKCYPGKILRRMSTCG